MAIDQKAVDYVKANFSEKEKAMFRSLFNKFGGTLQVPVGTIKRRAAQ